MVPLIWEREGETVLIHVSCAVCGNRQQPLMMMMAMILLMMMMKTMTTTMMPIQRWEV
jgi:hypothetical protein